ncbi:MAG: response regulator [Pseudomonadales bacterium]|nr:response regulator [Pseudomonadales bacterium]
MSDNIRLLYVEDEEDILAIAECALEDEGFDLLFCSSGLEALEKAEAFSPDILLLDVMMSGMDGPTTLEKLRKIPHFENIPALFLTAKVQPQEVNALLALGAKKVISKPFDVMTLADQIKDAL